MTAKEYIIANFDKSILTRKQDDGDKIGFPYPGTSPCAVGGHFNDLFYWDLFFTNRGLLKMNRFELAKNNCDNVAYMINRFGYMPNGTNRCFLGRSQPPCFSLMVKDVYGNSGDKEWLKSMIEPLMTEYKFWMEMRGTANGLNRHFGDYSKEQCESFANYIRKRVYVDEKRDDAEVGQHYFAEAESGWDFTARFNGYCADYNPIDLNCLIYHLEKFIGEALEILDEDSKEWNKRAEKRKDKINEFLFDKQNGLYFDYNYKTNELSKIVSVAAFMPYFVKIVPEDRTNGLIKLLSLIEEEHGLSATVETQHDYQWGYKNAWAPLHLIAVVALNNYGFKGEAEHIAKKWIKIVEDNFYAHDKIFEKYNAVTGGIDAVSEYGTPEFLGWTAGVYVYLKSYLETK